MVFPPSGSQTFPLPLRHQRQQLVLHVLPPGLQTQHLQTASARGTVAPAMGSSRRNPGSSTGSTLNLWGSGETAPGFTTEDWTDVFFENFGLDSEFKLIDGFVVDWTKAKIGFHRGICRSWLGKLVDSPSKIYILPWRIVPIIGIWYDRQYMTFRCGWELENDPQHIAIFVGKRSMKQWNLG